MSRRVLPAAVVMLATAAFALAVAHWVLALCEILDDLDESLT